MANLVVNKKKKFIADGVFYSELNEFLRRELSEDGYSGVEVRVTPKRTKIIIRATRPQNVLGDKGLRIRQLTSVVQKRFRFPEGGVELYAEKVLNRGLSAIAQAESLRYKLLGGLAVRRACYGVLKFVMDSGAKGVEVTVSGKLRAQRAKGMTFRDGYMIKAGQPCKDYIDFAVRNCLLRQGVIGIKVKIMLPWDPTGKNGPIRPIPDVVTVLEPKEDDDFSVAKVAARPAQRPVQQGAEGQSDRPSRGRGGFRGGRGRGGFGEGRGGFQGERRGGFEGRGGFRGGRGRGGFGEGRGGFQGERRGGFEGRGGFRGGRGGFRGGRGGSRENTAPTSQ